MLEERLKSEVGSGRIPSQPEVTRLIECYESGRFNQTRPYAEHFTEIYSGSSFGWKVLGLTLVHLGDTLEAINALEKASALSPTDANALYNLGLALKQAGKLREAEEAYELAISLKPDYADVSYNLGNLLLSRGELAEAEKNYKQAIRSQADFAKAHCNLGATLTKAGNLEEAERSLVRTLALRPDLALAHNNLGNTLKEQGRFDEAEASYRQAIALNSDYITPYDNLLMLVGSVRFEPKMYQIYSRAYRNMVRKKATSPFTFWSSSADSDCLRIGFVSGDFGSHPVGYFLEGLLSHLKSSSIELVAYPTQNREDDPVAKRLAGLFHVWSPLVGVSDEAAARKIYEDSIHILIDLSGHTAQNRLPIFAWKPAPIQVSWLGYFASTGIPEIDYVIGDPYVTPLNELDHFNEKIWQLPESYFCFTPPEADLNVSELPALSNGFVTFGGFNKLSRMTDVVVSTWAKILRAVPDSMLFLKDKQLDYESGRDSVFSRFARHGICSGRLLLEGQSSREEYLTCYNRVDIALSPFPYGGGTTSAEGLWMGVPPLAKKGSYFLSHLGESIAHNCGLPNWLAADEAEYVAKAVYFSSDLETLAALRARLREQVLRSPLFDAPRFSGNFERMIWAMAESL